MTGATTKQNPTDMKRKKIERNRVKESRKKVGHGVLISSPKPQEEDGR